MTSQRMSWQKLLCREKFNGNGDTVEYFDEDHDALVFSPAFRRLNKKTQVHSFNSNDLIRTRLVHSLEVGCICRKFGYRIGKWLRCEQNENVSPSDIAQITQAAGLMHDLGNPPFGHAGEEAIRDWAICNFDSITDYMDETETNKAWIKLDFHKFEGNPQALHLATSEDGEYGSEGFQLSYATLATSIKYPWSSRYCEIINKDKFGFFYADRDTFKDIVEKTGLFRIDEDEEAPRYSRHPLTFLMEAADDICYSHIDIEDAIELGIVQIEELISKVDQLSIDCGFPSVEKLFTKYTSKKGIKRFLRERVFTMMLDHGCQIFIENYEKIMHGSIPPGVGIVDMMDEKYHAFIQWEKRLGSSVIYNQKDKVLNELGAHRTIGILLDFYFSSFKEYSQLRSKSNHSINNLTFKTKKSLQEFTKGWQKSDDTQKFDWDSLETATLPMQILDHVSGMTDQYCAEIASTLMGQVN